MYDKLLASRQAEIELLTSDLERTQSNMATLERENETLRNRFNSKDNAQESRYYNKHEELIINSILGTRGLILN